MKSNQKLTLQDVADIRRRLANGEKVDVIAKEYGVTDKHIYNIRLRRKWTNA